MVVTRIDRLARSVADLQDIVRTLREIRGAVRYEGGVVFEDTEDAQGLQAFSMRRPS